MRVWLVTVGEPLPIANSTDRLLRTGLLAEVLCARGHEVLWWTSVVDHVRKRFFVEGEPLLPVAPGLTIQFLHGKLYRRNASISRILNHREVGRRFRALARAAQRPQVILASYPTIELSREAVRYARATSVPVIVDVRDLWPDIFLQLFPPITRGLGRLALSGMYRDAAWTLASADRLFAISDTYLDWGLARAGRLRREGDAAYALGYPVVKWSRADEDRLSERMSSRGVSPGLPVVIFVGTFGRTYDLSTVIDAARSLGQRGLRVQFIFCGTGEQEQAWQTEAASVHNVVFLGWLPAGELACLLSRSCVGLAAYAANAPQSIPNKVIEYLSAGLPVLSSLNGEARDLVESNECGLYYTPGQPQELVAALEELLGSPDRQGAMSRAARDVFARRFAADSVYRGMACNLELLADEGPRARGVIGSRAPTAPALPGD